MNVEARSPPRELSAQYCGTLVECWILHLNRLVIFSCKYTFVLELMLAKNRDVVRQLQIKVFSNAYYLAF
jgi:hypothetical protein